VAEGELAVLLVAYNDVEKNYGIQILEINRFRESLNSKLLEKSFTEK
jgi:hypothetical protein